MSSKAKVLYVGMTNNLTRRMYEHKNKMNSGLADKYKLLTICRKYSLLPRPSGGIIKPIEKMNPEWKDLAGDFLDGIMGKNEIVNKWL